LAKLTVMGLAASFLLEYTTTRISVSK